MDDYMDDGRDAAAEAAAHELMLHREREAVEALNRCLAAGAKEDDVKTLARECGINVTYLNLNGTRHAKTQ